VKCKVPWCLKPRKRQGKQGHSAYCVQHVKAMERSGGEVCHRCKTPMGKVYDRGGNKKRGRTTYPGCVRCVKAKRHELRFVAVLFRGLERRDGRV
jgi:hypothetical protein